MWGYMQCTLTITFTCFLVLHTSILASFSPFDIKSDLLALGLGFFVSNAAMTRPAPDSPGFLDSPALAPPPGVTPNFENPESLRQPELAVVQLILVTLVVCMRLFTKKVVVKKMLAEDCKSGFNWRGRRTRRADW